MTDFTDIDDEHRGALAEDLEREAPDDDASGEDDDSVDSDEDDEAEVSAPKQKRRRRRRKSTSPAHEERIARYQQLVEDRGWIFAPPSPPQPVSWLFDELTPGQLESLAG